MYLFCTYFYKIDIFVLWCFKDFKAVMRSHIYNHQYILYNEYAPLIKSWCWKNTHTQKKKERKKKSVPIQSAKYISLKRHHRRYLDTNLFLGKRQNFSTALVATLWHPRWFLQSQTIFILEDSRVGVCLNLFGCCKKNNIDWVAYKLQKFISHSSGGWIKALADLVSGEGPLPGSRTATFSLCPTVKRAKEFPGVSFIRAFTFQRLPFLTL